MVANDPLRLLACLVTFQSIAWQQRFWFRIQSFKHGYDHFLAFELEMLNAGAADHRFTNRFLQCIEELFRSIVNFSSVTDERFVELVKCVDPTVHNEMVHHPADEPLTGASVSE